MKIKSLDVRPEFFPILMPRVIDGDAIEAHIVLSFGVTTVRRIRLKGFWAPELNGRSPDLALKARYNLDAWLQCRELFIRCPSERQDKFGRIVAELYDSEGPADPRKVLGEAQMSEAAHKADLDHARGLVPAVKFIASFGAGEVGQDIGDV